MIAQGDGYLSSVSIQPVASSRDRTSRHTPGGIHLVGPGGGILFVAPPRTVTFRVTERRQDRPTITLEPNAASVHPIVRQGGER